MCDSWGGVSAVLFAILLPGEQQQPPTDTPTPGTSAGSPHCLHPRLPAGPLPPLSGACFAAPGSFL